MNDQASRTSPSVPVAHFAAFLGSAMLGGLLAPLLLVALLTEGLDGIVRAFGANGRLREWMGGGLILGIFAGMLGFGVMGMAMQLGVRVPWGWLGWSGAGLVSGLILGSCGIVWIGDVVI